MTQMGNIVQTNCKEPCSSESEGDGGDTTLPDLACQGSILARRIVFAGSEDVNLENEMNMENDVSQSTNHSLRLVGLSRRALLAFATTLAIVPVAHAQEQHLLAVHFGDAQHVAEQHARLGATRFGKHQAGDDGHRGCMLGQMLCRVLKLPSGNLSTARNVRSQPTPGGIVADGLLQWLPEMCGIGHGGGRTGQAG